MGTPEIVSTAAPTADDLLAEAEAAIRAYCGWHIAPSRMQTVTLDCKGGTVLILPSLHVTNVVSVTIDGAEVDGFTWLPNGVVRHDCFPVGSAEVQFTHGYDDVSGLHGIIRAYAARSAAQGPYVQVGQVRVATDASGTPLGAILTATEMATLDRYRLPPRP